MTDKRWRDVVALAKHYKAIGDTRVYLSREDDYPWEFVSKVEGGSMHRFSVPVSASFEAKHPCGITFAWSVDYEKNDANGSGTFKFDSGHIMSIHSKLPSIVRFDFECLLARAATDIRKQAKEYAETAQRLFGDASLLDLVIEKVTP